MLGALWHSDVRNRLLTIAAALLTIIFATAYAQVLLNWWNEPFYDSLARRDVPEFLKQLRNFAMIAGVLLVLNVTQTWLNQMTALSMREGLARDLVGQWLMPKRALRLSASGILGVNPDQRLHEDARHLSETTTSLAIGLFQATIMLASFVGVLWELSSGFIFHMSGQSFSIPGYMVWAAILYAGSASLLSSLVGRRLVKLNANRYSKEADLRSSLMRANENLEAITFRRGEANEQGRIDEDISAVLRVIRRLALALTNLTWVSAGYGWLTMIAPILIAAPVYFSGGLTFGGLMMAVGAFNQVYAALRWYMDNYGAIADWKATLMRVADFRHALQNMDNVPPPAGSIVTTASTDGTLSIRNLTINGGNGATPLESSFRIREQDVVIHPGETIMINGDPGVNRRLLFNALAGWWHAGTGEIAMPPERDILFLPQAAYLPQGTLRDVLVYPQGPGTYSERDLAAVLEHIGLQRLEPLLDSRARWDKILDKDEQTCLILANALLRRPRWIIFDDVLEGLEPETQEKIVHLMTSLPDTALIYIGRQETFFHSITPRVLHLEALPPARATGHPVTEDAQS